MIQACADAGLPADQTRNFLRAQYFPLLQMMGLHRAARDADQEDGPEDIGVGGTRGPGKSHACLAQVGLDDLQRLAGLKWLFLRKVQLSAAESMEDLVGRVFQHIPHEYVPSNKRVNFGNGSRIILGGYRNESDIEKYLGLDYDGITVEEATQLSKMKIDKINGSRRTSRKDWRPRTYYTTNADGIGLKWFKEKFVIPARQGTIDKYTRYLEASYKGNPYLNQGYHRFLEGLSGALAEAWRECNWDVFEGMAFQFKYDVHVCLPFELPAKYLRWRAMDWGSAKPWCCLWMAKDPDTNRVYVYREAYAAGLTDLQQAQRIVDLTDPSEKIARSLADPASYWEEKNFEGQRYTPFQEYAKKGVHLEKADNARLNGKRRVDNALALQADGKPGMMIFSTCINLIEQLSTLVYDPVHVEDVDTDLEDHAYDALRYGLSNYGVAVKKKDDRKRRQEMEDWKRLRRNL